MQLETRGDLERIQREDEGRRVRTATMVVVAGCSCANDVEICLGKADGVD